MRTVGVGNHYRLLPHLNYLHMKSQPEKSNHKAAELRAAQSSTALDISTLYGHIRAILEEACRTVVRSVNTEMVQAYWRIGQPLIEQELRGAPATGRLPSDLLPSMLPASMPVTWGGCGTSTSSSQM